MIMPSLIKATMLNKIGKVLCNPSWSKLIEGKAMDFEGQGRLATGEEVLGGKAGAASARG
jgi:hypothetical protein